MYDGRVLAFVEVKTARASTWGPGRRSGDGQNPLERLRPRQRARLRGLAAAWLSEHREGRPAAREIRFDAIGVTLDGRDRLLRLEHLEAAW